MPLIKTPEVNKKVDVSPLASTIHTRFLTKEITDFLEYLGYTDKEVKAVYLRNGYLYIYTKGDRIDFY